MDARGVQLGLCGASSFPASAPWTHPRKFLPGRWCLGTRNRFTRLVDRQGHAVLDSVRGADKAQPMQTPQ